MSCEVVCRYDGMPCWTDNPCVWFHPSGEGCVVCTRYKGPLDYEEYVLEVNI